MQIKLYYNGSDERVVDKVLTPSDGVSYTAHFKDDSSIINPVLTLSPNVNIYNYNYLYIPTFKRYYYITDVTVSTQRYIVNCKCDVLMSFKAGIKAQKCVIERSATLFNEYLEDERFKAYQYTHRDTYRFNGGFDEDAQEFILVVCGNPNVTANIGDGKSIDGGSTRPSEIMTPEQYEELPTSQKENNDVIIVDNNRASELPPSEYNNTRYWLLTESQYNRLTNEQKNDGTMYFIYDNAPNLKGTRNIFISQALYDALLERDKNNNIPYYIKEVIANG